MTDFVQSLDSGSLGVAFVFIVILLIVVILLQIVMDCIAFLYQRIYVKRCEYRWDMLYRSGDNVIDPCHWSGCPFRRDCPFYEKQSLWQHFKVFMKRLFPRRKKK